MSKATYSVGIDLGTTHTAVSYMRLDSEKGRGAQQAVLPLSQLTSPGTVEDKQLLPSFLYLPADNEFPKGSLALPWSKEDGPIVGELARSHGAKVPNRLVASAKSWLIHPGVDRRGQILPWTMPVRLQSGETAPPDVKKVSPLEASARYLAHLREAFRRALDVKLEEQEVVLTVPASFDAGARDLTIEAAAQAGLPKVTLLEEPQAALYAWLEAQGESWRKTLKAGDVLLVIDVGGGTSDFSLIAVREDGGNLSLERLALGDHLLLGGDNMDLALAHAQAAKFQAQGKNLDAWQMNALSFACRAAKEQLLTRDDLKAAPVGIPGRGSSLIGGTLKGELLREELTALLTDGFFPKVKVDDAPVQPRRGGLAQVGLPYAADAAITKHLGAFLSRQSALATHGKKFIHPTHVLLNGGVFKAPSFRARVMDMLNSWLKDDKGQPAQLLEGADFDLAVARGAAHYGWVKTGHGIRIRGGTARSYYVGVESGGMAVPGFTPPTRALCIASFGMEEGTAAEIPPQEFGLVIGEQTQFRFFSSSTRRQDKVGDLLDDAAKADGLEELPAIETALEGKAPDAGQLVPVNLQAALTELGALELRCLERGGKRKWKLELNVRMRE